MNETLALAIARSKMRELQVGDNYILRYRQITIRIGEEIPLDFQNQFLILINPDQTLRVVSQLGVFDFIDRSINEMQFVHTGKINLQNLNQKLALYVPFLQVIPTK